MVWLLQPSSCGQVSTPNLTVWGQIPSCRTPVIQAFDFSQQGLISSNEAYLCNETSSSSHRDAEHS